MQRTSVDLPEPDRPMMMKISPATTSSETLRTAAINPSASIAAKSGVAPLLNQSAAPAPNTLET